MAIIKLPKHKRIPGLFLYCGKHKRNYGNDSLVKCNCKLVYKAMIHVPNTQNKRKCKEFEETDLKKVIIKFMEFKEHLEATDFQDLKPKKESAPIYLTDCMQAYEDYLYNINVPIHKAVTRADRTVKKYLRHVRAFGFALKENNIDPSKLKFEDITDDMVGMYCEYVLNKINSNKTFNNYADDVKMFSRYIIKKYKLKCDDVFAEIENLEEIIDPRSMEFTTFLNVMEKATLENGIERKIKGGTTNHYRDWIRKAFLLGLFTAGRREEVVKMKWNGVKENAEGEITHIEVIHYKLTRSKSKGYGQVIEYIKSVEMSQDLADLIVELGYEKNKGKDEYILAPNEEMTRENMMDFITNSFTHYYKLLNEPEHLTFKNLRKTYSTELYAERGESASVAMGHTNPQTTKKYYVDSKRVTIVKGEQNKKRGGIFQKKFKF